MRAKAGATAGGMWNSKVITGKEIEPLPSEVAPATKEPNAIVTDMNQFCANRPQCPNAVIIAAQETQTVPTSAGHTKRRGPAFEAAGGPGTPASAGRPSAAETARGSTAAEGAPMTASEASRRTERSKAASATCLADSAGASRGAGVSADAARRTLKGVPAKATGFAAARTGTGLPGAATSARTGETDGAGAASTVKDGAIPRGEEPVRNGRTASAAIPPSETGAEGTPALPAAAAGATTPARAEGTTKRSPARTRARGTP